MEKIIAWGSSEQLPEQKWAKNNKEEKKSEKQIRNVKEKEKLLRQKAAENTETNTHTARQLLPVTCEGWRAVRKVSHWSSTWVSWARTWLW